MYVLLEFWQKTIAIPIMNPLSWFMKLNILYFPSLFTFYQSMHLCTFYILFAIDCNSYAVLIIKC